MRSSLGTSLLALLLAAPVASQAEGLSFSGGASLTSRYVSNGVRQSDGLALQPWIEGSYKGLYFGAWGSNTSKTLIGNSTEIDLYLGFRGEAGMLSYDINYTRYFYRGPQWDCCGEVIVSLGLAPTDAFGIGTTVKYDPDAKVTNASLTAGYGINDTFGLEATWGKINKGGQRYWIVSGRYAITDSLGASLAWHDNSVNKGTAVLTLDYSFDFH